MTGDRTSDKRQATLIKIASSLLGAALGAKMSDKIVDGPGLPSWLAQAGGAILGALGGKAVAEVIHEKSEPNSRHPKNDGS